MILKRLLTAPSLLAIAVLCTLGGSPGVALAQGNAQGNAQGTQGTHRNELIPLYDNANPSDWSTACSEVNGAGDGSWIIADPVGSGPGTAPIPAWTSVIQNCYAYGRASVIGYVWTDYGEGGTASIPTIENEIKSWYSFYHGNIAGIFFDGVSDTVPGTSTSNQSFYQTLASYVHQNEGNNDEVVFNFGANPASDWMLKSSNAKNADIVVTFEGSYNTPGEDPYTAWTQAAWERRYPAEDFAALVYNTTSFGLPSQPETVCNSLAQQNIGYVYVGTWYEFLPPYFSSFVSDC
jgi:spherulation-specific family 4 protein